MKSPQKTRALEQCTEGEKGSPLVAAMAAFAAHGLLFAVALTAFGPAQSLAAKSRPTELYEVELAPPPPAPEAPRAEPEPLAPEPLKQPRAVAAPVHEPVPEPAAPAEPEPPAPVAAQAAEALTAPEQAPGVTDTLVTGEGAAFAGGTTERGGASTQAVHAPNARALGVEGGTGNAAVDHSRAPELASGLKWDCPFPEEAREEGVQQEAVSLLVDVGPDGKVLGVEVKRDPGYGFAREARACAFKKRWLPGVDRTGKPARGKLPVNVRFIAE